MSSNSKNSQTECCPGTLCRHRMVTVRAMKTPAEAFSPQPALMLRTKHTPLPPPIPREE